MKNREVEEEEDIRGKAGGQIRITLTLEKTAGLQCKRLEEKKEGSNKEKQINSYKKSRNHLHSHTKMRSNNAREKIKTTKKKQKQKQNH